MPYRYWVLTELMFALHAIRQHRALLANRAQTAALDHGLHVRWDIRFDEIRAMERRDGRGFAELRYRTRLGFGLRNTAVSLAWRTGDDIVVSRTDPQHPVSYVNLDGVNSDGPSRNLLMPVTTVAANPSTVYVADERGVLQLSGSASDDDPAWADDYRESISPSLAMRTA